MKKKIQKAVSKVKSTKGVAARTLHKVRVAGARVDLGYAKMNGGRPVNQKRVDRLQKKHDKLVKKGPSYIPARKKKVKK